MRFFRDGHFYEQAPDAVHELPLDLLRSRTYPRDPSIIEQGIQEFQAGALPVAYMPQAMGQTQWKSPPTPVGYGQNVVSLIEALKVQLAVRMQANQAPAYSRAPVMDAYEAGRYAGGYHLPQPTEALDPNLRDGYVPLAENALPLDRVEDAAIIDQVAQDAGNPEDLQNHARVQAIQSVAAVRGQYDAMAISEAAVPWFVRG